MYLGFIAVLVILGLPEVPGFRRKLRDELDTEARRETVAAVAAIANKVRAYFGVTLVTSLLTGAATAGFTYAVGLELSLTWGVLNFLLNFIPVVGNIIGIVPPTLYALVQFGGWTMALVVLGGLGSSSSSSATSSTRCCKGAACRCRPSRSWSRWRSGAGCGASRAR